MDPITVASTTTPPIVPPNNNNRRCALESVVVVSCADTVVLHRSRVVKLKQSCIVIIVENGPLSQFPGGDDKITAEGDSTYAVHEPDIVLNI